MATSCTCYLTKVPADSHDVNSFSQADIHEIAADLVSTILSMIESAESPEKMAENDHLMRCQSSLTPLTLFATEVS